MNQVSLAVVIPTRNRTSLAIQACESLLTQTGCSYEVFVSDNCTDPQESGELKAYCARAGRATYLRPDEPVAMGRHWDWAVRTAMHRSTATHFTVHYDRRVTKPDHLRLVCDVMAAFPSDVVTWTMDQVLLNGSRSAVWQTPWDGRVYQVRTARVVQMASQGKILEMGQAFPILSNCAVPRPVLEKIQTDFGSVCDSIAPDTCFTFRFSAAHGRYIHFDRTVGIIHAQHRSTASGYLRGGAGGDFPDFRKSWGDSTWLAASPIPELNLGQNMLFHEYELVRRATDNPSFAPLDRAGYLRELGYSLRWVDDPVRAAELREILMKNGWTPDMVSDAVPEPSPSQLQPRDQRSKPHEFLRRALESAIARIWRGDFEARTAAVLFLAKYLNVTPDHICGFEFPNDLEAVRHAIAYPRRPVKSNPYLATLEPVEVTAGTGTPAHT
jgi:hypothetical protein